MLAGCPRTHTHSLSGIIVAILLPAAAILPPSAPNPSPLSRLLVSGKHGADLRLPTGVRGTCMHAAALAACMLLLAHSRRLLVGCVF